LIYMPEETFTIPLEIVKAERTSDGQMRIHGIATDETLDLQNEVVKANGLANCLEYLKTWGKFNDDHKRIFLGDIDQAEVTTRGALVAKGVPCKQGQDSTPCVYVGGYLFPKVARARHYWDVIESGGRVGMSVQGRPLATPVTVKSRDGQSEHRMWTKLFANQVALTVQPINTSTWVGIQKSFAGAGKCGDCSACPNIGSCCPGGECLRDVIAGEVLKSRFGVKIPRHLRCISRKVVPGRKQRVYEFASSTPLAHVSQLADGLRRKGHVVGVHPAPVAMGTPHVITARSKRGTEYRFHIYQRFGRSLGTGSAIVTAGTPEPAGAALRTQSLEGAVKRLTPRLTIKKKRKKKMQKSIERREDVSAAEKKRAAGEYGDVTYADPVNKKYPLDADHIHAAIAYFSKPKNQAKYSPEERKLMWGRIRRAAKKHGVDLSTGKSIGERQTHEGEDLPEQIVNLQGALVTWSGGKSEGVAGDSFGFYHTIEHDDPRKAGCDISEHLRRRGYRVLVNRNIPGSPHLEIEALKSRAVDPNGPISMEDIVQGKATRHVIWVHKSPGPEYEEKQRFGVAVGRDAASRAGTVYAHSFWLPSVRTWIHQHEHPKPHLAGPKMAAGLTEMGHSVKEHGASGTGYKIGSKDTLGHHVHTISRPGPYSMKSFADERYDLTQSVSQEEAKIVPTLDFQSIKTMMPGEIVKAWRTLTQPKEAVLHPPEEVRAFKVALAAAAREHSPAWAAGIAKSQGWSPAADMTELDIGVWMALAEMSEDDVAKAISRGEVEVCKSLSAGYGVDQTTPHEGWQELLKKAVEGEQSGCDLEAPENARRQQVAGEVSSITSPAAL